MKFTRILGSITALLAMITGLIGFGLSSSALATSGDGHVTVTSSATSTGSASTDSTTLATVNGATQLLWWYPNHNIKVSKKAVKKAPHVKIKLTSCASQSAQIAKQGKHRAIVVAKPGSVICNTGKLGHIVGGFNWHVGRPAVLRWNSSLHLYQHVYNVVGGKLVKTCGNRMGGHVDHMYPHVVQVRYSANLLYVSKVSAHATANATASASASCPNGTTVSASASASANAATSASVSYQLKLQASVLAAKKSSLLTSVKNKAAADAKAQAEAKIDISCGSSPQPTPEKPTVQIGQKNDVDVNDTASVCADYTVPASLGSKTMMFTAKYGSYVGTKSFSVSGSGSKCVTYKAPSEVPPGGKDTLTVNLDSASDSTPITINSSPTPPM